MTTQTASAPTPNTGDDRSEVELADADDLDALLAAADAIEDGDDDGEDGVQDVTVSDQDGPGAKEPGADPKPTPGAPPHDSAQADGNGQEQGQDRADFVPRARLNEEARKRRELEARIQELEQGKQGGNQQNAPEAPPFDPDTAHKALHQDVRKVKQQVAELFDKGDIGLAELRRREAAIDDRAEELAAEIDAKARDRVRAEPAEAGDEDLSLSLATRRLEQAHPWARQLSQADAEFLTQAAVYDLRQAGRAIPTRRDGTLTSEGTLMLRAAVVQAGYRYGVAQRMGYQPQPRPTQPGSQQPSQPQPRPGPSPNQRRTKADLAAAMPPDLSQAGTTGPVSDLDRLTASAHEMSEADLASEDPGLLDRMIASFE
ncbi:hypothetical protein F1188_11060 [Roseospira marina]|uniref:Uncharacterized protein n=1 Tax=Roseospira marina TaxID=140057 RepID=A0A5M6IB31_9PROT|nr:hypothetical protein [Roseospira marina]KAA5605433.1 hypothetical protein F1188_11060 [Roseospira marina]MBB4314572.1 hypothetical protein [Roseospira marina]MBB5088866.1 hypothetical protein [Roseospira marina]